MIGKTISHYRIIEHLRAGGMGRLRCKTEAYSDYMLTGSARLLAAGKEFLKNGEKLRTPPMRKKSPSESSLEATRRLRFGKLFL